MTTTACNLHTNGPAERCSKKIISQLRDYIEERKDHKEDYIQSLTYSNNVQAHESRNMTLFSLTLTKKSSALVNTVQYISDRHTKDKDSLQKLEVAVLTWVMS